MADKRFDDAFSALESLATIGQSSIDVKVENISLTLSTLGANHETLVFIACSELNGTAYFHKLKQETLKYAITKINNQELYKYPDLKTDGEKETLENETREKVEGIISGWREEVIDYLYEKWNDMSRISEEEMKKKGIVTNAEKRAEEESKKEEK